MRILFVASEGVPFSKTGGLGDVIGGLPKELAALGHEVAVLLPHYRGTKIEAKVVHASLTVPVGHELRFPSIVGGFTRDGVRYDFLDDPEYFDRETLYGGPSGDYADNPERFAEFSRAAIEYAKLVWHPDVIHCHDWQSALIPVLRHTLYEEDPALRGIPTVFTIHNIGYQGVFSPDTLPLLLLPWDLFTITKLEFFGKVNFLKGALTYSDFITTVSRKYAQALLEHLDGEKALRREGDRPFPRHGAHA